MSFRSILKTALDNVALYIALWASGMGVLPIPLVDGVALPCVLTAIRATIAILILRDVVRPPNHSQDQFLARVPDTIWVTLLSFGVVGWEVVKLIPLSSHIRNGTFDYKPLMVLQPLHPIPPFQSPPLDLFLHLLAGLGLVATLLSLCVAPASSRRLWHSTHLLFVASVLPMLHHFNHTPFWFALGFNSAILFLLELALHHWRMDWYALVLGLPTFVQMLASLASIWITVCDQ